jgi:hypothetical protein
MKKLYGNIDYIAWHRMVSTPLMKTGYNIPEMSYCISEIKDVINTSQISTFGPPSNDLHSGF